MCDPTRAGASNFVPRVYQTSAQINGMETHARTRPQPFVSTSAPPPPPPIRLDLTLGQVCIESCRDADRDLAGLQNKAQ